MDALQPINDTLKLLLNNIIKMTGVSNIHELLSVVERPFSFDVIIKNFKLLKDSLLSNAESSSGLLPRHQAIGAAGALAIFSIYSGYSIRLTSPKMENSTSKIIIFFPNFVYTIGTSLFCGLNLLINTCVYFSPFKLPAWDIDPNFSPAKISNFVDTARLNEIKRVILSTNEFERFNEIELMQLFDTLKPATQSDMVGRTWRGKIINCYCFLDIADIFIIRPLSYLGFKWGKRYRTKYTGDPLLFSWMDRIFFPLPLWGNVGIHEIVFRGKSNATMVYDYQPWQDYFRVLDDGSVSGNIVMLGLWCTRESNGGFFSLTYMPDVETD